jgi:hypothetical protein
MKKNIKLIIILFIKKSGSYRLRAFLFLLFIPFIVFTQLDSIRTSLRSDPVPGFKLESKYFLIDNNISKIRELKPYFEFNKVLRIGAGYCWLKKINGEALSFNAFTLFAEYLINFDQSWSAEVPIDIGFGKIKNYDSGVYAFFEPSFIIEYRGFKYINLGLGTGMRLSLHDRKVYNPGLTVQTLIVRLNLKFLELYNYFLQVKNT